MSSKTIKLSNERKAAVAFFQDRFNLSEVEALKRVEKLERGRERTRQLELECDPEGEMPEGWLAE